MEFNNYYDLAEQIIEYFVNLIDLDGEYYVKNSKRPLVFFEKFLGDSDGRYIPPKSKGLDKYLENFDFNKVQKKNILDNGVIVLSDEFKDNKDKEFLVTFIHEIFHANRNLLVYTYLNKFENKPKRNEYAYNYDKGKVVLNTKRKGLIFADINEDILNANIDNHENSIKYYRNLRNKIKPDDVDDFIAFKMQMQKQVDEALNEIMATIAVKAFFTFKNNKEVDLMEIIKQSKDFYDDYNHTIMCDIILRHRDFDLFHWHLDPIGFANGYINYDFFKDYTKNDTDILSKFDFYKNIMNARKK